MKIFQNLFKKKQKIRLGNKELEIKAMTLQESVKFVFLLAPYAILFKRIKKEFNANSDFTFMIKILCDELDKDVLFQAFSILLHEDEYFVRSIDISKLVLYLPYLIRINNMIDLFLIFKKLGLFDG